jgi:hypothetical protein
MEIVNEVSMDLLDTIDVAYQEYLKSREFFDTTCENIAHSNREVFKSRECPKVIVDQAQIVNFVNAQKENDVLNLEYCKLNEKAYEELRHATDVLLDAIPIKDVWYKISNGFIRENSNNDIEFVSFETLLEALGSK